MGNHPGSLVIPTPSPPPPPRPKPAEIAKWQGYIQSRLGPGFLQPQPRAGHGRCLRRPLRRGAAPPGTGFAYNPAYKTYNYLGATGPTTPSQVLPEGGNFPKTPAWDYQKEGSRAWVNAGAFKDYNALQRPRLRARPRRQRQGFAGLLRAFARRFHRLCGKKGKWNISPSSPEPIPAVIPW